MLALTTVECGHRRASQSLRGRLSEVQQKGLFSRLVSFYAFLPLPSLPPWTQLEGPHRLCCFFPLLCCKFVLLQLLEWIKAVSLTAQYCRLNFDHWNSLRVWFCLKKKTKKKHPFFYILLAKYVFIFVDDDVLDYTLPFKIGLRTTLADVVWMWMKWQFFGNLVKFHKFGAASFR